MIYEQAVLCHEALFGGAKTLPDEKALKVPFLYLPWQVPHHYEKDERFTYGTHEDGTLILWKAKSEHDSQDDWTPDVAVSLYEKVGEEGQGDTPDNPIPYDGNMELFKDKYYSQDNVTYICTRDSGQPLYHPLAQLVGLYVEVYEP